MDGLEYSKTNKSPCNDFHIIHYCNAPRHYNYCYADLYVYFRRPKPIVYNVVGLCRVPAKVNLNLNNIAGTWSDPNVGYEDWSDANPAVMRWLGVSIVHKYFLIFGAKTFLNFNNLSIDQSLISSSAFSSSSILPSL